MDRERLEKIRALAERGERGEREVAREKLKSELDKMSRNTGDIIQTKIQAFTNWKNVYLEKLPSQNLQMEVIDEVVAWKKYYESWFSGRD